MTVQRYVVAGSRVERLGGLAAHLLAFLLVNAVLFTQTGFRPGAGHFWGWGIGVAAHAFAVVGPGARLKERLITRQLSREPEPRRPR